MRLLLVLLDQGVDENGAGQVSRNRVSNGQSRPASTETTLAGRTYSDWEAVEADLDDWRGWLELNSSEIQFDLGTWRFELPGQS